MWTNRKYDGVNTAITERASACDITGDIGANVLKLTDMHMDESIDPGKGEELTSLGEYNHAIIR